MLRGLEHAALGEVAEQPGDGLEVLRGQHLGRRQQRGLAAGVDHSQHRPKCDQGLARAHLALQQSLHRPARPSSAMSTSLTSI